MYKSYFGFREKPFKLVPNPDYLFLSKSHEVALAHLNYATDQGDGFVIITGEVGTGKTTLCRNYLEQLDEQTKSAYIFNPKLDSVQLLTSICHEFGIETKDGPSTKDLIIKHIGIIEGKLVEANQEPTTKELLDKLYQFLIAQHTAGHKVVLLIDEAQALSVENLEMVRMVSNLETTRSKLLQIILVGQPELGDQLDTYELRQLAQRISLNCYLTPLSEKETIAYMQHRVNIAAQKKSDIFSANAARQIHEYAAGIPRLINIACDRALLAAYSQNKPKVNGAMVKKVVSELSSHKRGKQIEKPRRQIKPIYIWLPLAVAILLAAGIIFYQSGQPQRLSSAPGDSADRDAPAAELAAESFKVPAYTPAPGIDPPKPEPVTPPQAVQNSHNITPSTPAQGQPVKTATPPAQTQPKPTPAPAAPQPAPAQIQPVAAEPTSALAEMLNALDPETSRINALTIMLSHWGQSRPNPAVIPAQMNESQFFQIAARQYGLRAHRMGLDWPMIKRLNLPAVIVFRHPQTRKNVYLALVEWENQRLVLADGGLGRTVETDIKTITGHAQGAAYIYWKNTLGYDAIISSGAETRAIMVVKTLLRKVGYDQLSATAEFDRNTRQAVRDFQGRHQITADGLVGPLTKIFLIQQANAFDLPVLSSDREAGA